jgi:hypothetical protein
MALDRMTSFSSLMNAHLGHPPLVGRGEIFSQIHGKVDQALYESDA